MTVRFPTVKLGRVARTISGVGFPHDYQGAQSGEIPFLKVSDLSTPENVDGIRSAANWISRKEAKELGARIVPTGSVVFPKVGAALLKNTRNILMIPAAIDNNLMAVVPTDGHPRFWYYALSAVDLGELSGGGPIPYISDSQIRELHISFPEMHEQRRIARILDSETVRIDRIIALRHRQLQLAAEREETQIFDAIRGAYERGARKYSGLAWLGDIPEAWTVASVFTQYDVQLGKMLNQDRTRGDHLRPYLRNFNVQWDRIDTTDLLCMDFPPRERARYSLRAGDLLICEGGEPGRAAVWDGRIEDIYYQKALHRARSRGSSSVRWLYYCLRVATAMSVFVAGGNTTTISHLTGEQLRAQRFPFPPVDVQHRIVGQLDKVGQREGRLKRPITVQLGLLGERKSAMITGMVATVGPM